MPTAAESAAAAAASHKRALLHFLHLFAVAAALYITYITYGVLQEWFFHYTSPSGEKFTFTNTLLFVQCAGNLVAAFIGYALSSEKQSGIPSYKYLLPGSTFILAMYCSNESLKFVNYPTQALAKSCKMIPVLLVDTLFYGKKHGLGKFVFVAFVTAGIVMFRSKSHDSEEHNSLYGLGLLFISLIMDGVTAPKQQDLKREFHATVHEAMLYTNFWALIVLFGLLIVTGENFDGIWFILHPENITFLHYLVLFSLCSALGQLTIFYTVHTFGALMCSTITTTRKFFTVLVSIFSFNHAMGTTQWVAIGMVFSGLLIELRSEYQSKYNQADTHAHAHDAKVQAQTTTHAQEARDGPKHTKSD